MRIERGMTAKTEEELISLIQLIPKLYFKLSAVMAVFVSNDTVSPGQRALIEDLHRLGPSSIGSLAAMRPVAKQYIQKLVSDLAAKGLVKLARNPDDGRSKLVALSRKSEKMLGKWRDAERAAIVSFLKKVTAEDVETAKQVLEYLHTTLEAKLKDEWESQKDKGDS